jgi:hypothetical protein
MKHIPTCVKKPTQADEVIGAKPSVGDIRDYRREREFPRAKSPVEISCPRTRNHDGIEVSSVWLSEERASTDVKQRHQYGTHQVHRVDWGSDPNLHQGSQFRAPYPVRVYTLFRPIQRLPNNALATRCLANRVQVAA